MTMFSTCSKLGDSTTVELLLESDILLLHFSNWLFQLRI